MAASRAHRSIGIAVFQLSGDGTEVQLFPAGEFRSVDGRPGRGRSWRLNAASAARLIASLTARANDLVIDYEHQSLLTRDNGQPAPAAGWFRQLEWREGQGLFAVAVRWSERARQMIDSGEYRYISPVFQFDTHTGEVIALHSAGLTNVPAIDGMQALSARAAAALSFDQNEEESMNEELLKLLGLQAGAPEEDISKAVAAVQAKLARIPELESALVAAKAEIGQTGNPDPNKFVSVEVVESLKGELATLKARFQGQEIEGLVEGALEDGRLLPAQADWARELGRQNFESLKSYLEKAQPIPALRRTQTGGKPPVGDQNQGELTEDQLIICRRMGLDPEEFKKTELQTAH